MKNSLNRIVKITIASTIALACWFIFQALPWHPPIELDFKDFIGQQIVLEVQKSDGSFHQHRFTPTSEKPRFTILASKVVSIQQTYQPVEITYHSYHQEKKLLLIIGKTPFPIQESMRNHDIIFEACLILTSLVFLLMWNLLENFNWPISPNFKKKALLLGLHVLIMSLLFYSTFPGFMGWDSFENYKSAAFYRTSTFIGDIYLSTLMVLFQLFPHTWITAGLNSLVIVGCLTIISNMAIELKTLRYYLLGLLIFFLYPVNPMISLYAVRDISCFWILITTILLFYYSYLKEDKSFGTFLLICTGTVLSCLMRQESLLILLPGMILIAFFFYKDYLKRTLITGAAVIVASLLISIINPSQMDFFHYQTTLLVNPLSYILKHKYPEGLPPELNQELGTYFKNDYLIKYQENHEILPFHKGGINPHATAEDFRQFRRTALRIILTHPGLFIQNRLSLMQYLFNFYPDWTYVYSDGFYDLWDERPAFFDEVLTSLSIDINDYQRPGWSRKPLKYLSEILYDHHIWFASYIIPILLMFSLLILRPFSWFYASLLAILSVRTLLVCFIAPAGYFKYLYPLWIFAPFVLCLLWGERKLRLTKAQ